MGRLRVNRFNHTGTVDIVIPTDRPESVRNRCVIEVFGGVCCVDTFSVGVWASFIAFSQISFFFY